MKKVKELGWELLFAVSTHAFCHLVEKLIDRAMDDESDDDGDDSQTLEDTGNPGSGSPGIHPRQNTPRTSVT